MFPSAVSSATLVVSLQLGCTTTQQTKQKVTQKGVCFVKLCKRSFCILKIKPSHQPTAFLAEWSKAPDSSSGIARCVGSNPTGCKTNIFLVIFVYFPSTFIAALHDVVILYAHTILLSNYSQLLE
jgi:hypothetical protein